MFVFSALLNFTAVSEVLSGSISLICGFSAVGIYIYYYFRFLIFFFSCRHCCFFLFINFDCFYCFLLLAVCCAIVSLLFFRSRFGDFFSLLLFAFFLRFQSLPLSLHFYYIYWTNYNLYFYFILFCYFLDVVQVLQVFILKLASADCFIRLFLTLIIFYIFIKNYLLCYFC